MTLRSLTRQGWTTGRIKNLISEAKNGVWGDDPLDENTGIKCVRAADFNRQRLSVNPANLPTREIEEKVAAAHRLRPGDLILEKSGGGEKQPAGAAVLFDLDIQAVCSNFCARLRPTSDTDPRFLKYVLASAYYSGITAQNVKQTTGIQNLDMGAFLATSWTYPSHREQRCIADFLDVETARIDDLDWQRKRQIIAIEERHRRALSDEFEALIDAPRPRLGYLCSIQTGITVDGARTKDETSVTRPYLRVANVQAGRLNLDAVYEITVPRAMAAGSTLRKGDVLMTEGGDLDKLGRGTVWGGEIAECLHQNHVFALRVSTDRLLPAFLALFTQAVAARMHFESTGNKTTNLASTSSAKIRDLRIPLPALRRQHEIVNEISSMALSAESVLEALARQRALLAERRSALITAAVTGRIDLATGRGADQS